MDKYKYKWKYKYKHRYKRMKPIFAKSCQEILSKKEEWTNMNARESNGAYLIIQRVVVVSIFLFLFVYILMNGIVSIGISSVQFVLLS